MLARNPSHRRRASRSGGSSPQPIKSARIQSASPCVSPSRRASIAISPIEGMQRELHCVEMNRSPRHSMIPDISLESHSNSSNEDIRISLDTSCNVRHSLLPGDYFRSPRNSLIPETPLSSHNIPVSDNYNRSPRNSLVPEISKSPRHSLVPDVCRSPKHSLTPETISASRLNLDFNRSPRNSLLPDGTRGSRQVLITSESSTWLPTNSDDIVHNPNSRHSIALDCNRSPRGSIAPDRMSHRGSIVTDSMHDRSPRGSIAGQRNNLLSNDRSPRGSLTLTFQDTPVKYPRRYSTDYGQRSRSASPYRSSRGNVNQAYNQSQISDSGSRRASSSVSQVSGDEQKHLFSKNYADGDPSLSIGITLTTYGSVAYQLKDANLEANDTCDFIYKALQIFNKTVVVTVVLICMSTLPFLMLVMGAQFLRDCPREQYIPIYMVVGGTVGCVKMAWVLWNQLYISRLAPAGVANNSNIGSRILSYALTIFLIVWFVLGNYWILRIKWPDYAPTLFEPNRWCHSTLYVFAIVHLCIIYAIIGVVVLLIIILAGCQIFGCPWLASAGTYK